VCTFPARHSESTALTSEQRVVGSSPTGGAQCVDQGLFVQLGLVEGVEVIRPRHRANRRCGSTEGRVWAPVEGGQLTTPAPARGRGVPSRPPPAGCACCRRRCRGRRWVSAPRWSRRTGDRDGRMAGTARRRRGRRRADVLSDYCEQLERRRSVACTAPRSAPGAPSPQEVRHVVFARDDHRFDARSNPRTSLCPYSSLT
jgi:hypothetical protein